MKGVYYHHQNGVYMKPFGRENHPCKQTPLHGGVVSIWYADDVTTLFISGSIRMAEQEVKRNNKTPVLSLCMCKLALPFPFLLTSIFLKVWQKTFRGEDTARTCFGNEFVQFKLLAIYALFFATTCARCLSCCHKSALVDVCLPTARLMHFGNLPESC